ncbi:MAG: ATP-dependent exonuclease [Aequorivita sp.]|nr:ATP-dependent exonuclease [Aequorivita sp.]|tara:strand:- start:39 stop:812 length:774 start_codon:yes stop_codon:yes gene_type:complete
MKKLFALLILFGNILSLSAQEKAYGDGEFFKFRVHYGFVTAGYATLKVKNASIKGKEVFHVRGYGETVGVSKWFFKVEDDYQSYIDKEKDIPYRFIRKIDEGGYTKDIEIDFNHNTQKATVNDKKHNEITVLSFPEDTQDMISAFYYLRNQLDTENIKTGDVVEMNMFFDQENYKFRLKFLGKEVLDTNFGRVRTLIFRPYVQSGRVFKEKESLTVWISDDKNKIPLLVKADLAVGSLKATLTEFKGLQHSFKIIAD